MLEPFSNASTPEEVFITLWQVVEASEGQGKQAITTWKEAVTSGYAFVQQKMWKDAFDACFKAIELEPGLSFPHFIKNLGLKPRRSTTASSRCSAKTR